MIRLVVCQVDRSVRTFPYFLDVQVVLQEQQFLVLGFDDTRNATLAFQTPLLLLVAQELFPTTFEYFVEVFVSDFGYSAVMGHEEVFLNYLELLIGDDVDGVSPDEGVFGDDYVMGRVGERTLEYHVDHVDQVALAQEVFESGPGRLGYHGEVVQEAVHSVTVDVFQFGVHREKGGD